MPASDGIRTGIVVSTEAPERCPPENAFSVVAVLRSWLSPETASAISCTPNTCVGSYMYGDWYDCYPGCWAGLYQFFYADESLASERSGYRLDGGLACGTICPQCRDVGCIN